MYPPKVQDQDVLAVIRDLSANAQLPSGAAVRTVLAQRYGSRGGVTRIYRLLANERARQGATLRSPVGLGLLEQENRNLREMLQHQRQREGAHQAYWSRAVDQLRERVVALEAQVHQALTADAVTETLKREVAAAETRAGQLEVQLRAFGPAPNRGESDR
jgi:hypothetical protein